MKLEKDGLIRIASSQLLIKKLKAVGWKEPTVKSAQTKEPPKGAK